MRTSSDVRGGRGAASRFLSLIGVTVHSADAESLGAFGRRKRYDVETRNTGEVCGVARVKRKTVGERRRGDHGVIGSRRRFAPRPAQRCSNLTERTSRTRIERQRFEVRLGLLEMRLPGSALLIRCRDERSNREFGKRDRGDQRLLGQEQWIIESRERDDRARVENSAFVSRSRAHSSESSV